MAKICMVGLPGKIGRCIITGPSWPPIVPPKHQGGAPEKTAIAEPGLYAEVFVDTAILGSIHDAAKGISDPGARKAVADGLKAAVDALLKRTEGEVRSISLED